jgi:penicillin-binding protein 1C
VRTAAALGPERVLDRLRDVGLSTLDRPASDYGVAIALGDGETRLLDLANAYATLARRGRFLPVRAVKSGTLAGGGSLELPQAAARPVLDPAASIVLADILSDDRARAASFGRHSSLELPFPAAAKTGTSKGFRDNIAAGFTREVTVAVWVGNFDGSPMEGVSGVTGAGPLFNAAMVAAQALYPGASRAPLREQLALPDEPPLVEAAEICPLSGEQRGPDCPHGERELVPASGGARSRLGTCDMHVHVRVDRRNGLRAGKSCPATWVEQRVFERHPPDLVAWAKTANRPLPPASYSALCPADPGEGEGDAGQGGLRLAYPPDGAVFVWDPHAGARQSIVLRAETDGAGGLVFLVDGHRLSPRAGETSVEWALTGGVHRIWVESGGRRSESAEIRVE